MELYIGDTEPLAIGSFTRNYFDRDYLIQQQLLEHYNEVVELYGSDKVLGVFLCGSQNYKLDYDDSDVDTKCIIIPSLDDIVLNHKPVSTTHMMKNESQCDIKDIRHYFKCGFKKQNINFVEILFTDYFIINRDFQEEWNTLRFNREAIARYCPYKAIKSMSGQAMEKYTTLERSYPCQAEEIAEFGFACYHPDTLFLTKRGWQKYEDIIETDELGTMNPQTFELEWQKYTARIKKQPTCDLYDGETYDTHFCITEDHNVFSHKIKNINKIGHVYNENIQNDWILEPLKTALLSNRHRHIISFPKNKQNDNPDFSDELLQLFGAFISEGSINFRDKEQKIPRAVRIYQTENGKMEFFTMMDSITTIPLKKYTYYKNDEYRNGVVLPGHDETIWITTKKYAEDFLLWGGHISLHKRLPDWIYTLSQRQADILLQAMLLGDGTEHKSRWIYYTGSQQLAKDTCALANLAGYTANVLGGDTGYFCEPSLGNHYMWQVQITKRNYGHSPLYMYFDTKEHNLRNSNFYKLKNRPENVVCFTVPNGLLITMYQGKTAVQGNCKQLHHLLRIEYFIEQYIKGELYEKCLVPPEDIRAALVQLKATPGLISLDQARARAKTAIDHIIQMADDYCSKNELKCDEFAGNLLNITLTDIIKKSLKKEII